jgi:hypothetical protein
MEKVYMNFLMVINLTDSFRTVKELVKDYSYGEMVIKYKNINFIIF